MLHDFGFNTYHRARTVFNFRLKSKNQQSRSLNQQYSFNNQLHKQFIVKKSNVAASKNRILVFILLLSVMLSGCVGTLRQVSEDEKILYKQRINAPGYISKESLKNLYAQQHVRRIPLTPLSPLTAIYYWGEKNYDPEKYIRKKAKVEKKFDAKIANTTSQRKINNYEFRKQQKLERLNNFIENGNLRMQWGEKLSIFDSAMMTLTQDRFKDYLFSQGYFNGKVSAEVMPVKRFWLKKKAVNVEYTVSPGPAYFIDSIFYNINDTTVLKYVLKNQEESFIKKGTRYNQNSLTKERERLDLLLKDNGFYDFSRQYIEYKVDSASLSPSRQLIVQITINDPAKRGYHKQFAIDSVNFTLDAGTSLPRVERQKRTFRHIAYHYYDDNYNLKILSQRVFLQPGELYSRTQTFSTQRQLANVDAFKFININYDTTGGKFIANIFSSPLPRYEWSNEAGVNVTQGFPGPFYSVSFRKRNVFKGLENFELSGRFGFEGVASATSEQNVYKSTEASINASLTFPQFIWPFKERVRFKLARYNPRTRFTTGYSYTDRPEYRRTAISLNGTYAWQNNRNVTYSLTPFNMSVIDTANLSGAFRHFLARQDTAGNFSLINSFRPSFVNSIIFGVTWNYNNYGNNESNSSIMRVQLESGGTLWNFITPSFISDLDLQYYKYLRLSVDLRRIRVFNKTTALATRFNGGVAYPYSSHKSLPYEKFFFVGGTTSVRAWYPRRLGPGSFKPDSSTLPRKDGLFSYRIEKPGDILLEGSIELRKKLFGFVSGAVFVDAGNVWTFEPRKKEIGGEKINNGNSQFKVDQFYKEIGVGTGFGLRFDFTFLILRFDVGIKMYDPARDENDRFVLDKVRFWRPYATQRADGTYTNFKEPVNYNVGIGYSF